MSTFIIGLTGGIGSGKSSFAQQFEALGICVLDADSIVHELYIHSSLCKKAIVDAFGIEVLSPDGTIDRAALCKVVFACADALKRLNSIVHPLVLEELKKRSDLLNDVVVWDVPLLIESGMIDLVDAVVVVVSDTSIRRNRLKSSRGMTDKQICDRMKAQLGDFERMSCADYICVNNGSISALSRQAQIILADMGREEGH
ncbi:MAG: dephospho-CoA kinase [Eubacteriales bacterium]|nr:dephospho-CoA kinase [Eubacteriales bacterium]